MKFRGFLGIARFLLETGSLDGTEHEDETGSSGILDYNEGGPQVSVDAEGGTQEEADPEA